MWIICEIDISFNQCNVCNAINTNIIYINGKPFVSNRILYIRFGDFNIYAICNLHDTVSRSDKVSILQIDDVVIIIES